MSAAADVPMDILVISFLKELQRRSVVATVVMTEAGQIGKQLSRVASNNGPTGVAVARHALLMQANSDATIERVARALHEFRFVEQGQSAPAPEADMCMFGPCIAAEPSDPQQLRPSKTAWAELPPELKEAHMILARLLIVAMTVEPEPPKEARKLVIPTG